MFTRFRARRRSRTDGRDVVMGVALVTGCTRLDTSGADRCEVHSDCNSGRICEDGRCTDMTDPEPGSDASKPSATAGTGSTREMPGAAGRRAEMDGGMDSAVARPETGTAGSGTAQPDTGTAGSDPATAGTSGSGTPPTGGTGGGDADTIDPDRDGGEMDLPFRDAHPCGQGARNFDNIALWLSSAYGIQADDQQHA